MNVRKVGGTIGSTSPFSRALFEPFVHSHPTIFKGTSQDAFLHVEKVLLKPFSTSANLFEKEPLKLA
ncbi:hypothetical protein HZH66_012494 [Vespula vulgaris]|uniref:Uncharacterized protein n=1 Tax=Vespula vulgaris TaxID=7454 RepID=A0A834MUK2_VESVU|nr:hypothetical protein HZH66_012494 [Vespula vulgaris]